MVKVGVDVINIKKLLSSPHITVRYFTIFRFHNMCGHGNCRHESCRNCCHTNYHFSFNNSLRKYRLPNFIQTILRKIWD